VDCVSGEIVQAVGNRWIAAGPPNPFVLIRPEPDEPEGPPVFAPSEGPECADLAALFLDRDESTGRFENFADLTDAGRDLDPATRDLIARFIEANETTPNFAEF